MRILDRIHKIGTFASLTCSIHCMAMPLLIAFSPLVLNGFLGNGRFDRWMLLIGILLPLPDLCWGFRKHRSFNAFFLLFAGFMWWWIAHEQQFLWKHNICIMMCGIAFLWSNRLNRQLCNSCSDCSDQCAKKPG